MWFTERTGLEFVFSRHGRQTLQQLQWRLRNTHRAQHFNNELHLVECLTRAGKVSYSKSLKCVFDSGEKKLPLAYIRNLWIKQLEFVWIT